MAEHTNRLIHESSPYLRQHAHNPVDWHPWGPAALATAQQEKKPILLSVGYSACHWCHVMERESFEDAETAALMNEHFVNIKVDREERPDVDHIYMNAVQLLTGHGGWPMTVFLTPDGEPFYGGTYFPPEDRHGLPSFRRVLQSIATAYRDKPQDVQRSVTKIMTALNRLGAQQVSAETPDANLLAEAATSLSGNYDSQYGGFGRAPKFPNTSVLDVLLRAGHSTGQRRYTDMVLHTLRRMAHGGIYDQVGGGFHRYSVDQQWLVPHFEKMLYDNAQLAPLYLAAYQLSGDDFFATIARDTLAYVTREMRDEAGGFYSTQDADSEGEEGKFFVWDQTEVNHLLGDELGRIACRYWDVTDVGNFEHRNILHVTLEIEQLSTMFKCDADTLRQQLAEARATLFAARARRIKPAQDTKILTAWNGLMISAFAKAADVFDDDAYRQIATGAVAFVNDRLRRGDRLLATYKDGAARLNGYLDDYAFFVAALLDTFEAVQDRQHLTAATRLTESMLEHFWDASDAGFFFTSDDHEALIVRTKPAFDGSIPSGNSVAVSNLLRLYHYTGNTRYLESAEAVLRSYTAAIRQQPFGFANLIAALDYWARSPREIVIVGERDRLRVPLFAQLRQTYLPNRTLTILDPHDPTPRPPLLEGKGPVDGQPTVYVCHRMTCSPPATTWSELEPLLRA